MVDMGKLREDLKIQLKEAGQWPEFIRLRDELKLQGCTPKEAQTRAVAAFFKNPPKVTGQSASRKTKKSVTKTISKSKSDNNQDSSDKKDDSEKKPVVGSVENGAVSENQPEVKKPLVGSSAPPLKFVDSDIFEGKQAPEVEIIRWVARNMMVIDPLVEECPDASAWALLAHCRQSNLCAAEFWKTTYTKLLPSRAQMEASKGEKDTDGSKTTEVIDELLSISKEAEKLCGNGF